MPADRRGRHQEIMTTREKKRANKLISCAECHRLKLKCDKQVPCNNCTRRGCDHLCPNGVKVRKPDESETVSELRARLATVENFLQAAAGGAVSLESLSGLVASPGPNATGQSDEPQRKRTRRSPSVPQVDNSVSSLVSPPAGGTQPAVEYHDTTNEEPYIPASPVGPSSVHFNYDTPVGLPSSNSMQQHVVENNPLDDESHGTLVITRSGRSKWLGPTAGTEWLKDQETLSGTPSRSPSPGPQVLPTHGQESQFPFGHGRSTTSLDELIAALPPGDEASVLVDSYYRYYTWNHDVAPRRAFQPILDRTYASLFTSPTSRADPQDLGLIFAILAMGTLHSPDLPPADAAASGDAFMTLAERSLVRGSFLVTARLPAVQALILMGHYRSDRREGDAAWPLWGLAMRLVVAMGLHRDGERFGLPPDVAEERRHVFWESHTIDVFQANCFSRPCTLRPEHIDTLFPGQSYLDGPSGVKSFKILKYELCRLSGDVLEHAMDVRPKSYTAVTDLYDRLITFEGSIPHALRCRAALQAMPSIYPDAAAAIAASPEVNRRNLHRTFQQYALAVNISETILFLQRPYFLRALHANPADPARGLYARSYLAVMERCNITIQVVSSLQTHFPTLAARHWFFWYHLFTAAVCVASTLLKAPTCPLVPLAFSQLDLAIATYKRVAEGDPAGDAGVNWQWLVKLRRRAAAKVAHAGGLDHRGDDYEEIEDDAELLGWRTRLVERGKGVVTISNPGSARSGASVSPQVSLPVDDTSTDMLLQQFWDPTILQSNPGNNLANWWNWDDFDFEGIAEGER